MVLSTQQSSTPSNKRWKQWENHTLNHSGSLSSTCCSQNRNKLDKRASASSESLRKQESSCVSTTLHSCSVIKYVENFRSKNEPNTEVFLHVHTILSNAIGQTEPSIPSIAVQVPQQWQPELHTLPFCRHNLSDNTTQPQLPDKPAASIRGGNKSTMTRNPSVWSGFVVVASSHMDGNPFINVVNCNPPKFIARTNQIE